MIYLEAPDPDLDPGLLVSASGAVMPSGWRPRAGSTRPTVEGGITVRVCHLIDHLDAGGAQQVVVDLVAARRDGIVPVVVSLRDSHRPYMSERARAAGATVHSLGLHKWDAPGLTRLRDLLADGRFDILHAHLDHANSSGIVAALSLGDARRPRIVSHLHNDPASHNGTIFRAVARTMAPRVDSHVAPSASMAAAVRAALRDRPRRLETIENGIDLETYRRDRSETERGRELRGGAKRVVGFVGRLARQKRADLLLETAPALLRAEPSTRILLVGDGPEEQALRKWCRRRGLSHAVQFAGHLDDVIPAFLAMDVFVLPSDFEGFGLVLAEAMAMEVPVVATRVTGVVDVVRPGVTGTLVEPGDAAALTASILEVFADPPACRERVLAAHSHVRATFSRDTMTHRFEALYDELTASGSRNPAGRVPSSA